MTVLPHIRTSGIFLLLFILTGGILLAWGRSDRKQSGPVLKDAASDAGEIIVSGRIRLVGSASFTRLVITDAENKDWYLEGPDRDLLAPFEQQTLTVRGIPEYRDIILANGQKAGTQRLLKNISLIKQ